MHCAAFKRKSISLLVHVRPEIYSIRFNWRVMKSPFLKKKKKKTKVYEEHVLFFFCLHDGSVCTDSNQKSRAACCMRLHGFYISSAIWVLLPEQLMNKTDTVTCSGRRGLHFTQQLFIFFTQGLLNVLRMLQIVF